MHVCVTVSLCVPLCVSAPAAAFKRKFLQVWSLARQLNRPFPSSRVRQLLPYSSGTTSTNFHQHSGGNNTSTSSTSSTSQQNMMTRILPVHRPLRYLYQPPSMISSSLYVPQYLVAYFIQIINIKLYIIIVFEAMNRQISLNHHLFATKDSRNIEHIDC